MMHTMAQWNWGGLAFVGGMFALVALSGWATERLRRWAERPEPKKTVYLVPDTKLHTTLLPHHCGSRMAAISTYLPQVFSDDELRVMRSATERKQ